MTDGGRDAMTDRPLRRLMRGEAADTQAKAHNAAMTSLTALIPELELRSVDQTLPPQMARAFNEAAIRAARLQDLMSEPIYIEAPAGGASNGTTIEFGLLLDEGALYSLADFLKRNWPSFERNNLGAGSSAEQAVRDFITSLDLFNAGPVAEALDDLAAGQRRRAWTIRPSDTLDELLTSRRAERLAVQDQEADDLVEDLRNLGNRGASERLAQTFSDRADDEASSALKWTWLAIVFVVLGIVLPVIALSLEDRFLVQLTGNTGAVIKALIGAPFFVLSAYSAKVASERRRMSAHMRTLTNQIDTVRLYVAALPKPVQEEIIAALGRRAFSEPGITAGDSSDISTEKLLDKVLEVVREVRKP
ncbi:hypothetical protein EB72_27735 [Mycobacterium sp. SWH-M1]|nr:hypothetical protein EB72_27735 [Mycobacterium sp. SWH-M1]